MNHFAFVLAAFVLYTSAAGSLARLVGTRQGIVTRIQRLAAVPALVAAAVCSIGPATGADRIEAVTFVCGTAGTAIAAVLLLCASSRGGAARRVTAASALGALLCAGVLAVLMAMRVVAVLSGDFVALPRFMLLLVAMSALALASSYQLGVATAGRWFDRTDAFEHARCARDMAVAAALVPVLTAISS